jgi:regulator of sigma E protease
VLDVLWSIAAFVVALGVLVSFHEYGHFWVARRLGVKVLRFSIGFGKPLWRRQGRDGVEYVIAAVPLGGYVKMLDEREGDVPIAELPRAFNRQHVWKRIAIVSAGPLANFVMAVVAYWMVFVAGVPGLKPVLAEPRAGTPAAVAGLRAGDEILRLDDKPVATWQRLLPELIDRVLDSDQAVLEVRDAQGAVRDAVIDLDSVRMEPKFIFEDLGLKLSEPQIVPVLKQVLPGGAAVAAGFQPGDRLLSRDGVPLESWQQWTAWVRAHPGEAVNVEVARGSQRLSLTVILAREERSDGSFQGRFGASVDVPAGLWDNLLTEHRLGVFAAMPAAVAESFRMSGLTLKMLYRMVLGDVSVRNISGPIQIAEFAGDYASNGLVSFLSFIAIMSVSLFVLNLLPVPVLDGGHLLYFLVEWVKGSPLSERAQMVGQQVGITLLVGLMGLAFYNDILSLIN